MIKKLFFAILILVGFGGTAGVVLMLVYFPRAVEDVEFRCQFNMQWVRFTNATINRDGKIPLTIEDAKEFCESRKKESEKRLEKIEKKRKEYYTKKSKKFHFSVKNDMVILISSGV